MFKEEFPSVIIIYKLKKSFEKNGFGGL